MCAVSCRDFHDTTRERDARADRPIMRELFELSTGRRSAVRVERVVSAVSAVNAAGDSADPLPGPGASIPLAGKCRREGCVSKRHFAAPGVARRTGGGDIIAREEPKGEKREAARGEISRQSERKREIERGSGR